jgi:GNAT superfamily N-acetyltransferase
MHSEITITYLEMTSPAELKPSRRATELNVIRVEHPLPEFNRFLYATVGRDWQWIDRLPWSREKWVAWLDRPQVETHVAYVGGTPAGYFELESQPEGNVEVAYIGLVSQFIGKGLGGSLVTRAVERAWQLGPSRVWLHTCTLDHPHALKNYLARGFKQYHQETIVKDHQPRSAWPWHG